MLATFPELLLLRNSPEQWRALGRAERNVPTVLLQVIVAVPGVWLMLLFLGSGVLSRFYPPLGGMLGAALAVPAILFLMMTVPTLLTRRTIHARLRRELGARGIPVCPVCGADLRGAAGSLCPKCGRGSAQGERA